MVEALVDLKVEQQVGLKAVLKVEHWDAHWVAELVDLQVGLLADLKAVQKAGLLVEMQETELDRKKRPDMNTVSQRKECNMNFQ